VSHCSDVGGGLKYEVSVLFLRRREGGCQQFGFETMFEAQVEPVKCISLGVTTNGAAEQRTLSCRRTGDSRSSE
jgi:hypothetical protein